MNNGFIKVAAASPSLRLADVTHNTAECISIANQASALGVKLLVFPELSLTGYSCRDLFFSEKLLSAAKDALREYICATAEQETVSIIGLPMVCNDKIYNCAAVTFGGRLLGIVPKTYIPNYGGLYETRYFASAPKNNLAYDFWGEIVMFGTNQIFVCPSVSAFCFGIEICEDLCASVPPSSYATAAGATVIANLSASGECVGRARERLDLVRMQSKKAICGYIYASASDGESTTDEVFSSHSLICEAGELLAERKPFDTSADKLLITDIDVERLAYDRRKENIFSTDTLGKEFCEIEFDLCTEETVITRRIAKNPFIPEDRESLYEECENILAIQSRGLAHRLKAAYAKRAVVGISGGLDSTLALLVMAKAMDLLGRDRRDILAVTMPCFGTTKRTRSNAEIICEALGVTFREVNISESVRLHFKDISHDETVRNAVYENAQARERTQVLMDIANAEGGIVVGTGDLSELALGWATYNGDQMSMYGVNASVPKTLVREIVGYCAKTEKAMGNEVLAASLIDILNTPVSPELLPADEDGDIAQKTEDLVGPYEIHDFYIYYTLKYGFTPKKLYRLASVALGDLYDAKTLLKWLEVFTKRFFSQQFKRSCMPDGAKVCDISLSPRGDWRMPSDASCKIWLDEIAELTEQI